MLLKQLRWVVASGLIVSIALILAACDPEPEEAPPTVPEVVIENTLQPPFISQTPQYTATLTPSMTFTPSTTPTASDTPTPITPSPTVTATPTAPPKGTVTSSEARVIVREGPGREYPEVTRVDSGTVVDVLESDESAAREEWYRVRLVEEDGTIREGWILGRLIQTDAAIPTVGPTPTVGVTIGSPAPFATAEVSGTPIVFNTGTPPAEVSEVNIWAYCDVYNGKAMSLFPRSARSDQTVSLYWSWFVTRPELMADHIAAVDYNVTVNGSRLQNWQQYATQMRRDARNNNNWTVYWYVPLGQLEPGEYTVEYQATWSKVVNDGLTDYGPGTANTEDAGTCTFTITE